jgi:isocitrate dehydrogenase
MAAAAAVENALLVTLEDGKLKTGDVVGYESGKACSTTDYTAAIIANLGRTPANWKARACKPLVMPKVSSEVVAVKPKARRVLGADVFVETGDLPAKLGPALEAAVDGSPLRLKMISNRGTQVYPDKGTLIDCVDHYRCRFVLRDAAGEVGDPALLDLLARVAGKYQWMHVEKLQEFDGQPAFTKAQGED